MLSQHSIQFSGFGINKNIKRHKLGIIKVKKTDFFLTKIEVNISLAINK